MQRFTLTIEVWKYSYGVIRELFGPQFRPRFPELGTVNDCTVTISAQKLELIMFLSIGPLVPMLPFIGRNLHC